MANELDGDSNLLTAASTTADVRCFVGDGSLVGDAGIPALAFAAEADGDTVAWAGSLLAESNLDDNCFTGEASLVGATVKPAFGDGASIAVSFAACFVGEESLVGDAMIPALGDCAFIDDESFAVVCFVGNGNLVGEAEALILVSFAGDTLVGLGLSSWSNGCCWGCSWS